MQTLSTLEFFTRLAVGLGCGALIGAERQWRARRAGLRTNALVAAVFLTMLNTLGGAGMFTVFALLASAGFAMVYRFAPETKGRQLEEIRHFWENDGHWPDETRSAATDVPAWR